ncbi:MAG: NADH-quinone oxidoreductase subunit L [Gemmatimonadales bacterium]|nr:NADH-quinone oxidoreductase subunit L [Gemmatimonadales bacterium]NIN11603.1 NADH-quinone oxidoreductase subunit L [Gemmatimonadales bacterium]NIN50209.1 NADH-quinone oxidoreductase subunit L [Gemmatimonadales bacterium]NIP07673.1 NADH-quinone oxidoreductase subunit L [Gemmatimonadales bacterium]NIR01825.1 NADH-quinone oxidoreductase subunit L [Gemmatimonadales bacterium]
MPASVGWVWLVVLLPLAGFVANGALSLLRPEAKRAVSAIGVGVLVLSFLIAVGVVGGVATAAPHSPYVLTYWQWMPAGGLEIDLAFQVDQLSAVMLMVVTGVSMVIHIFSVGYMGDDPGYARYFAYLNLFVFFMLVLVLGANFPVMFVGWEGVGLCSYLLIGFWFENNAFADAGKKAFIMNRIGDFGFLIAMFMIFHAVGSLSFVEVFEAAPGTFEVGGTTITLITLALFLGCAGKSAQIPLYTWLPDAMAGPTPVSALIHAATMVTAGVYLVARTNVLFAIAPVSSFVVAAVGAATALFAATIALKQWDIKKVLAYSTVSQLGYMFMGVGVGAYAAGMFHLTTHAFFKALLFLGSGSVIHALHHAYHATHRHEDAQDMRNMGGLRRAMPWTTGFMWVATLAIAGVPLFSGFFSKDEILAMTFVRGHDAGAFYVLWMVGVVAALLTAFYMTRMMLYTFHGPNRTGEQERGHLREAPWVMTGPLLVLAVGSVFAGLLNLPAILPGSGWLHHWLEPVTEGSAAYLPDLHLGSDTEWMLLGLATVVAAAGILGAWNFLKPAQLKPAREAPVETGIQRVLLRKWYVDEIYDWLVVRPVMWMSDRAFWKVMDVKVIDGAFVNGSATVARALGWVGSRFQTGSVGVYLFLFVMGVLILMRAVIR